LKEGLANEYREHLRAWLKQHHGPESGDPIDLIAVTGDLADFDRNNRAKQIKVLKIAKTYLVSLSTDVGIAPADGLIIIPGNHDYLFTGLFRWPGWWGWLGATVKWNRWWDLAKDMFRRRTMPQVFADVFEDLLDHRWYPHLNLLAACFDSNVSDSSLLAATGYVNTQQFADLNRAVEGLVQEQGPDVPRRVRAAFRLALVHHHALPISSAEHLRPESWGERRAGRKLVGSPDMMLLRNAGHFLDRLLDEGFHLVLHGHLHAAHSSQYQTPGQGGRVVEVIAAGATGRPSSVQRCEFNLIRLGGGVVEARACQMDGQGQVTSDLLPTATYDTIRGLRPAVIHAVEPPRVRCEKITCFMDVRFPSGDIEIHEEFAGLSTDDPEGLETLKYMAVSIDLPEMSEASIEAHAPDHPSRVSGDVSFSSPGHGEAARADFSLTFHRRLGAEPLTVVCRRRLWGGYFSSKQALRFFDPDARPTPDRLLQKVHWPCGQFLIRVRFSAAVWLGGLLKPVIKDHANEIAPREEAESAHVMMTVNLPKDLSAPAEALVGVHRPRLGFRYGFEWGTLDRDPLSEKDEADLRKLRRRLLSPPAAEADAIRAERQQFLLAVQSAAAGVLFDGDTGRSPRSPLTSALYGFDGRHLLPCVQRKGEVSFSDVRWGRDVLGLAFRRHQHVSYSRRWRQQKGSRAHAPPLKGVPQEVQYVFAYPLFASDKLLWPIGVVALASLDPGSELQTVVEDPRQADNLSVSLGKLWPEWWGRVLGQPAPLPPGNSSPPA
jgi:hypothetical protein